MTSETLLPPVIKYLLGEGAFDGCHYPDFPDNGEKYKRRHWWRKALRDLFEKRAVPPSPVVDLDKIIERSYKVFDIESADGQSVGIRKDVLEALRQVATSRIATIPDGWQPIETAPKDGYPVLVYVQTKNGETWIDVCRYEECCWFSGMSIIRHPTHWQPLPAAPKPTGDV